MSRKLITLFAILCVTLSSAAFAGLQNIKVSGDITSQAIARDFGSEGVTSSNDEDQNFLLTQIRLRFDADLAEQVSATVALINERVWGSNGYSSSETDKNNIELDLAYVTLKQAFYDELTLIVGRQNLYYGTGMIVGAPATNQTGDDYLYGDLSLSNGFDAVRAIIDLAPYTIDLVYAKINEGDIYDSDDSTLYGVNAAYDWSSYNGLTEAYFFASSNERTVNSAVNENQSATYVLGARTQFNPTDKTTLGVEGAWQFGDANDVSASHDMHRNAMAANLFAQYRMLDKYNTTFGLCYAYFSGDDDPTNGRYSAWDPMYEAQSPAEIMNILVAQSGVQSITASASFMPKEDITIKGSYTQGFLTYDFYSPAGTYSPVSGPAKDNIYYVDPDDWCLGGEIDGAILYDYTEDVQMSLSGAVFIPGGFFESTNGSDSTMYSLRGGITVSF